VLVFVSPGCPLGDKYLPRLAELAKAYEAKGVLFFGVASGAGDTAEELKAWVTEQQVAIPILHDVGNKLADAVMVERSNEAILVDLRGTMRYRGAIDDQYGYDVSLPEPRHTWLVDAIDAVLDGNPKIRRALETKGIEVHAYQGGDVSLKGDGGPTCLTRELLRRA
jgi:hypothetical protein